jgi:hypothetical protein
LLPCILDGRVYWKFSTVWLSGDKPERMGGLPAALFGTVYHVGEVDQSVRLKIPLDVPAAA